MPGVLAESAHWAIALVPVLVLLSVFVWLETFKLMSLREILLLLLLGALTGIVVYPVSGRLIDTLPIGFSNYSRFVAPWLEEASKAAAMIGLFWFNRIGYKLDAVISGFAIGAGFSVVENMIYLSIFPEYGTGTWLVRGLGTAVMHGTTLAILGAIAHEFAERETRESAGNFEFSLWWFVPGYFAAVAIHIVFNQFPDRPMLAMLGAIVFAPVAVLAIFHGGTAEAQRWLKSEHATHKAQLEVLQAGNWPDTPAGKKIKALAERMDPESAKRIRRYWELQAWLVAEAEETLLEQVAGDVSINKVEIRAAFAELDGLKRALGRSSFAALKALLPFSRNDYWEVSELRQRLS